LWFGVTLVLIRDARSELFLEDTAELLATLTDT
jgi:hypothetical protein